MEFKFVNCDWRTSTLSVGALWVTEASSNEFAIVQAPEKRTVMVNIKYRVPENILTSSKRANSRKSSSRLTFAPALRRQVFLASL